jgi:hypothetical protein
MTFKAKAEYYPIAAVVPINFGVCQASTLDKAVSILMDDIREFMRNEESNNWWDDMVVTVEHDHVRINYPFEYWAKEFGWSF